MQSVGNDIVDLSLIDTDRSKQARFYSKILADSELALYQSLVSALPFERYVWLCWTIKEAAYKYSKRLHPELLFSPPRTVIEGFAVDESSPSVLRGVCSNGLEMVHFRSIQTSYYIHTIVGCSEDFERIVADVFEVDVDNAPAQTHARLLDYAKQHYPHSEVGVVKDGDNIPSLVIDQQAYPVSISHHGRYGSFVIPNF